MLYVCTPQKRITTMQQELFDVMRSLDGPPPDAFWQLEYLDVQTVRLADMILAVKNAFMVTAQDVSDIACATGDAAYMRRTSALSTLRTLYKDLQQLRNECAHTADEVPLFLIPYEFANDLLKV